MTDPYRVVTIEYGERVERIYPNFVKGWDARYVAGQADKTRVAVIAAGFTTEVDYQLWKELQNE